MLRDSNDTLGGGVALVTDAPRHRRNDSKVIEHLQILSEGRSEDVIKHSLDRLGIADSALIATAAHLSRSEVDNDLIELIKSKEIVRLTEGVGALHVLRSSLASLQRLAFEALKEYHRNYPLRRGMPRQELRNRLEISASGFDAIVQRLADDGAIIQHGTAVCNADHRVEFTEAQKGEVDRFLGVLREHRYSPPAWNKIDAELLGALADRRKVVSAGPDVVFAAEVYDEMLDTVVDFCHSNSEISINNVRDLLGTSRKYSLALLEQLDRDNVTMRVGDMRKLR